MRGDRPVGQLGWHLTRPTSRTEVTLLSVTHIEEGGGGVSGTIMSIGYAYQYAIVSNIHIKSEIIVKRSLYCGFSEMLRSPAEGHTISAH